MNGQVVCGRDSQKALWFIRVRDKNESPLNNIDERVWDFEITAHNLSTMPPITTTPRLSALGFCGVDDSVHVDQLLLIAHSFPEVEFGVLFRPDIEGQPRYASAAWVQTLTDRVACYQRATTTTADTAGHHGQKTPKLAAHLCGSRVTELLYDGDMTFLVSIIIPIFTRVQINATAVNGVDTSRLDDPAVHARLRAITLQFPQVQFILQQNNETAALCDGLTKILLDEQNERSSSTILSKRPPINNVAMLCDESKGTGLMSSSWPAPTHGSLLLYETGYAGGIGPDNVTQVLPHILRAVASACDSNNNNDPDNNVDQKRGTVSSSSSSSFWIDMESSLRSIKNGRDVFDLDKCYQVIDAVCQLGLMTKPPYLSR